MQFCLVSACSSEAFPNKTEASSPESGVKIAALQPELSCNKNIAFSKTLGETVIWGRTPNAHGKDKNTYQVDVGGILFKG